MLTINSICAIIFLIIKAMMELVGFGIQHSEPVRVKGRHGLPKAEYPSGAAP